MPFDDQILLLPRHNYWDWLQACRPYMLTFGPNATPDPGVAARYMAPRQVVTFPRFEGAFPEIGDPLSWFRLKAAGVRLDPVEAGSPAEMAEAVQRRVHENDRYGARRRTFHLVCRRISRWSPSRSASTRKSIGATGCPAMKGSTSVP